MAWFGMVDMRVRGAPAGRSGGWASAAASQALVALYESSVQSMRNE